MPGVPEIIEDRLISDGGWQERPGRTLPESLPAAAYRARRRRAKADAVDRASAAGSIPKTPSDITNWLAHRVQHPGEKTNHALVLGGGQGIGKDTILQPVKMAVGAWNFQDISPDQSAGALQPVRAKRWCCA